MTLRRSPQGRSYGSGANRESPCPNWATGLPITPREMHRGVNHAADGSARLDPQDRAELKGLAAIFADAGAGSGPARHPLATTRFPAVREDGTIAGLPWTAYDESIHRFWRAMRRLDVMAVPFDGQAWLADLRASGRRPSRPRSGRQPHPAGSPPLSHCAGARRALHGQDLAGSAAERRL
jgi:hypothetical protein